MPPSNGSTPPLIERGGKLVVHVRKGGPFRFMWNMTILTQGASLRGAEMNALSTAAVSSQKTFL
jgi:hypothetical protein